MQLNKIFEQILKEADSLQLYFREDPDSDKAYFDKENGQDILVGCNLNRNNRYYEFIWQRSKSNENFTEHGFTHYLTRYAYADEFRIIDGQKRGNKTINIKTDDGNKGLLCVLPLDKFGYWNEKADRPEIVLLLVRQEEAENGNIKLISCYSTDKLEYLKLYTYNARDRQRFGSKRPDTLDKKDSADKTLIDNFKKKMETAKIKQKRMIEQIIEEYNENFINDLKRGYNIFQSIIHKYNI
jgi:hypothetical protein